MFARVEPFHKSKIVGYLQEHFKEMFAGITAILLNEEQNIITGRLLAAVCFTVPGCTIGHTMCGVIIIGYDAELHHRPAGAERHHRDSKQGGRGGDVRPPGLHG